MEEEFNIRPELESPIEEKIENSLRPQTLDEYIGQTKVKENMKIGIVTHKNVSLSKLAREYIESIKKYMV